MFQESKKGDSLRAWKLRHTDVFCHGATGMFGDFCSMVGKRLSYTALKPWYVFVSGLCFLVRR